MEDNDSSSTPLSPASGPQTDGYQNYLASSPLPDVVDTLVVLGIGLGEHIRYLLESRTMKNMVIYEPDIQFFSCSNMIVSWRHVLDLAQKKGTALFFQLGKDGRDLVSNINELREQISFDRFFVFKHYNSPVFNAIDYTLRTKSWSNIVATGLDITTRYERGNYEPLWLPSVDLSEAALVDHSDQRFESNLAAFKYYFPEIYKEFSDYSPSTWLSVRTASDEINLLNKHSLNTWYGDSAKQDSQIAYEAYASHPNRDGLVLGYNGTKLRHYLHYKFVMESEKLLESISESQGALPQTIKSMIMFGLGSGYQLEALLENHDVEMLFLCEPNRDFFYASLFAVDWAKILKRFDEQGYRIYINIGDDGANLFHDLLSQFYSIGPYNLAHTYFYQAYYNAELSFAVAQLREQLQVVISMGEYFDHAYYGINHTLEGIDRKYPHLVNEPSKQLSYDNKECPVFIVGNGPSLDYSIDTIKENRDEVILVSCGTALQVLHRHNIVPDFHAEIEQNRSTFDWAVRLGDLDYLKKITLIACNGIHPDTCELYRDVMVCFKYGESSTESNLQALERDKYAELKFAFPTVCNFTLNLFTTLDFNQIYLFGVDLGFVDTKHHHSKQSGYYDENGKPLYDYAEKNNTGLVVQGNFRKTVSTKHEFKVSRIFIEDLLRTYSGDCYNTSDGARIAGSQPLAIDNVLVLSSPDMQKSAVDAIKSKAFVAIDKPEYKHHFSERYQQAEIEQELASISEKINSVLDGNNDIMWLIESLKRSIFESYANKKSLLFYYLYGSINFANAFLVKVVASDSSEDIRQKALSILLRRFEQFATKICADFHSFDMTSSFGGLREREYLRSLAVFPVVTLIRNYSGLSETFAFIFRHWREVSMEEISVLHTNEILVFSDNVEVFDEISIPLEDIRGVWALISDDLNWSPESCDGLSYSMTIPLPDFDKDEKEILNGCLPVLNRNMYEVLVKKCYLLMDNAVWFIPKFNFVAGEREHALVWLQQLVDRLPKWDRFISFPGYLAIPRDTYNPVLVDKLGNRGDWIQEQLMAEHLLADTITKSEFSKFKQLSEHFSGLKK